MSKAKRANRTKKPVAKSAAWAGRHLWRLQVGQYLRRARLDQGLSLRQLADKIGVFHSELFKIEQGSQDIRLDTFERMFQALGIPPGLVLDDYQASWLFPAEHFRKAVAADDASIQAVLKENEWEQVFHTAVQLNIERLVGFAVDLIFCSNASRKVRRSDFPTERVASAFQRFALKLDSMDDPLERQSLLKAMEQSPVAELRRHDLLDVSSLKAVGAHIGDFARVPFRKA